MVFYKLKYKIICTILLLLRAQYITLYTTINILTPTCYRRYILLFNYLMNLTGTNKSYV